MIDLMDYGATILSAEEFYVNKKHNNRVDNYSGYASNLDCRYTEGPIYVDSTLVSDDKGSRYDVTIRQKVKSNVNRKDITNSEALMNFNTRLFMNFDTFREYIDTMMEKQLDEKAPFDYKSFRYDTAGNKTEEDFTVTVNAYDNDFDITVDKDCNLSVRKYNAIVTKNNDPRYVGEHYTFFDNGCRILEKENGQDKIIDTIFNSYDDSDNVAYGGFKNTFIYNLPTRIMVEINHIEQQTAGYKLNRDEYGLICKATDTEDNEIFCLYEKEGEDLISSFNKRYYDPSFLAVPENSIFEICQIDLSYDDRLIKYTRSVVQISKVAELIDDINNLKAANPDIVIIKQIDIPEKK
jgi:hypothetical protein